MHTHICKITTLLESFYRVIATLNGKTYYKTGTNLTIQVITLAALSIELEKRIADLYTKNRQALEELDPNAMEAFASSVLEIIETEKERAAVSHDTEVLEQSMKHLRNDSALLKNYEPNTDDYDFTRNDCKNLITSTRMWLQMDGLIT